MGKSRPYFLFGAIPFAFYAFLFFNVPIYSDNGHNDLCFMSLFRTFSMAYTIVNATNGINFTYFD